MDDPNETLDKNQTDLDELNTNLQHLSLSFTDACDNKCIDALDPQSSSSSSMSDLFHTKKLHLRLSKRACQISSSYEEHSSNFTKSAHGQAFSKSVTNPTQSYVDPYFPPNSKSIFDHYKKFNIKSIFLLHSEGLSKVKKWSRPSDINVEPEDENFPLSLFANPSAKDVLQGGVGSCWFISALSALAERPDILYKLIAPYYYNENGYYQVRLCRRGEWQTIDIDDFLPVDRHNKLVFAYAKKHQFWVSFVEKALAKMYESFEAIASGACVEGLQTLTGDPCEVLYLDAARRTSDDPAHINEVYNASLLVWQKILTARKYGYLMTTLCFNKHVKFVDFQKVGLFNRHIYTVLDAKEFNNNGEILQLIKLRNPWGKKEWKGEWSNNWPHWPDNIKSQVSTVFKKNDGCFWISFRDLLKYFYDVTICKARTDWYQARKSSYFYSSNAAQVYTLTVSQPGAHQFELELFATGSNVSLFDRNADPEIDLCLVLCRLNDQNNIANMSCIDFEHNVEYFVSISAVLAAGNYLIYATSMKALALLAAASPPSPSGGGGGYAPYENFTYNLVVHGQCNFAINQVQMPLGVVADIFYSAAVKSAKIKYDLNGSMRTLILSGSCTHAIIVENLSYTSTIRVELNTKSSKNLDSTRLDKATSDFITPRTRQLINYLTPHNYHKGYVIGYKIESSLISNFYQNNIPSIPFVYSGLHAVKPVTY